MPELIFIDADGTRHPVDAPEGMSVMRAAVTDGIDGILAECGGQAACATCHVFVEPSPALPKMAAVEDEMLDATAVPRRAESRLSCQILVTPEMEGMEVRLPETQS